MSYVTFQKIDLKNHPEFNERWVQERIGENPTILGLGDVIVKDKERNQPRAGRLDLLLQDADSSSRYEVEIQLGSTEESHIIRTIEYWDIERRRYPQYDHTAVIVAEDITSRFLNVISLFNGFIPLLAIQMNALKLDENVGLMFTTVMDQRTLGLDDEEEIEEPADRAYWENRGSKKSVAMADELLEIAHQFDPALELNYNKFYIGLAKNGQPCNFMLFRPKKAFIRIELKLAFTQETSDRMEEAGIDVTGYDERSGRYRIRLQPGDIEKNKDVLSEVIEKAYQAARVG